MCDPTRIDMSCPSACRLCIYSMCVVIPVPFSVFSFSFPLQLFLQLVDSRSLDEWGQQLTFLRSQYEQELHKLRTADPLGSTHASSQNDDPSTCDDVRDSPDVSDPLTTLSSTSSSEDLRIHNPLSRSIDSKWLVHFADNELCETIRHDLHRTHPEQEFFQKNDVQNQMMNILFVWAKLHPHISYRQGMNEVSNTQRYK